MEINKGDKLKCIYGLTVNGITLFERNKEYQSDTYGYVTDEEGGNYKWIGKNPEKFFELIKPKLNIQQIRIKKEELQNKILNLIHEFEKESDSCIMQLDYEYSICHTYDCDVKKDEIIKIKIEI